MNATDQLSAEILTPDQLPAHTPSPRVMAEAIDARMADHFGFSDYRPATEPLDHSLFNEYLCKARYGVDPCSHPARAGMLFSCVVTIPTDDGPAVGGGNHDQRYPTPEIALCNAYLGAAQAAGMVMDAATRMGKHGQAIR